LHPFAKPAPSPPTPTSVQTNAQNQNLNQKQAKNEENYTEEGFINDPHLLDLAKNAPWLLHRYKFKRIYIIRIPSSIAQTNTNTNNRNRNPASTSVAASTNMSPTTTTIRTTSHTTTRSPHRQSSTDKRDTYEEKAMKKLAKEQNQWILEELNDRQMELETKPNNTIAPPGSSNNNNSINNQKKE
jgi:hypothetical protein